jgi:23S rRNA pseudouridine2605 synthase
MLNKPPGYVVTKSDEYERKTVYDLLPDFARNLNSIGRLDKESEGLLLLTNNGDFANQIIHPRYKLSKTYIVSVKGSISDDDLKRLREGIVIESKKTLPAKVYIQNKTEDTTLLKFVIYEGRKRQIRIMLEAVNCSVQTLKRTQIGDVSLGNLPRGMWRHLLPKEILSLREMVSNRSFR